MKEIDIKLSQSWWTDNLWSIDPSMEERKNRQVQRLQQNALNQRVNSYNVGIDNYGEVRVTGDLRHIITPEELARLKSFENKYIETCQEYENTIQELEEVITNKNLRIQELERRLASLFRRLAIKVF